MNKIIVEISIGELLDKISILEIKKDKIKDPEKLKFISNEHSILKNQLIMSDFVMPPTNLYHLNKFWEASLVV